MTTREQLNLYFLIRAQAWNDSLSTLDAATVANVLKTLKSVREDVRRQLLDNAGMLTDWRSDRLQQLDAWVSEVLAGASATVTGTITEAAVLSATASLVEYNAMMSLDGASSVVKTVGFTREQLVTWFRDTDIFEGMNLTTRVDNVMSAGAKDAILEAIRKAGVEGKGTAAIVQRAIDAGVDAGFQLTEREAVTLARSYVQAANVGAMDAVMEANKGLLRGWRWAAKLDSRTCPRCFEGTTEVVPIGRLRGVSKRPYTGEFVVITTATGKKISATPKHPILTTQGWCDFDKINPCDQIVYAKKGDITNVLRHQKINMPTEFAKLFDFVGSSPLFKIQRSRTSTNAFHGDSGIINNQIATIYTNRLLRRDIRNSILAKNINNKRFGWHYSREVNLSGDLPFNVIRNRMRPLPLGLTAKLYRKFGKGFPNKRKAESLLRNSFRRKSLFIKLHDLFFLDKATKPSFLFGYIGHSTMTNKETGHGGCRGVKFNCDLTGRHSLPVEIENVVSVRREFKSTHVYNLHCDEELYIANGFVVKNCAGLDGTFYKIDAKDTPPMPLHWRCRCQRQFCTNNPKDFGVPDDEVQRVIRPWVEREPGTIGRGGNRKILNAGTTKAFYGNWFKALSPAKQNDVVGSVRAELLRNGKIQWGQLIDKTTGRLKTLDDLGFSLSGVRK